MTTTAPTRPRPRAVFTEGSTLCHVLVMTSTGSIGLMAVFVVDLLSLLYISWLRNPSLTAGVGFASQILFFVMSINIGLSIAVTALVSRAIGAGDRALAQRLAASGLVHTFVVSTVMGFCVFPFSGRMLELLGARGDALAAGTLYLNWTLPTNNLMALGMAFSGVLRAVGDAKRAMYVTLFGAIVTAALDPVLILGLHMGVFGAAITANISRLVWIAVGSWGAIHIHGLIGRPTLKTVRHDIKPMAKIAIPVILTNLAAPVANLYSVHVMASFGEAAVAAGAIIDRVTPVAFGVLFAMSGVVGPVVGQNFGAGLMHRVRSTLTSCFILSGVYVACVWFLLWLATPLIVWMFSATGVTARLITFYCEWGAMAWAFLGCLFAANAAYNNLGYAALSTLFNWGRATLGVIPFVTLGSRWYGPEGVLMGIVVGASLFGTGSIICAYWLTSRLIKRTDRQMS